jgi:hypothetical protein
MAKKKNFKKAERLDIRKAGQLVRVYNFPDSGKTKKTGKKCMVCEGEIVEGADNVRLNGFCHIGENTRSFYVVRKYHCNKCGIIYAFLPR